MVKAKETSDRPQTLEGLRAKIDLIDDQIQDLIIARWNVVKEIKSVKQNASQARVDGNDDIHSALLPLRPEREAKMLRRLMARHQSPFPASALVRIWHEIIGGFTQLQQNFTVSVLVNHDSYALWDLAKDQFGSQTKLIPHSSEREVLAALHDGHCQLAVLPFLDSADSNVALWAQLVGEGTPNLIMALPFIANQKPRLGLKDSTHPKAMVIAYQAPVASGDDSTMVMVELKQDISRSRFMNEFQKELSKLEALKGVKAQILAVGPSHQFIVVLDRFVDKSPLMIINDEMQDLVSAIYYMGAFANGPGWVEGESQSL